MVACAWAEGDPAARGADELDHLGDLGGHRAFRHQFSGRKLQVAPLAEQRLERAAQFTIEKEDDADD